MLLTACICMVLSKIDSVKSTQPKLSIIPAIPAIPAIVSRAVFCSSIHCCENLTQIAAVLSWSNLEVDDPSYRDISGNAMISRYMLRLS